MKHLTLLFILIPAPLMAESFDAIKSKEYLQSIQYKLTRLRVLLKEDKRGRALRYEMTARAIDSLPMLKVDDELLTFGIHVSSSLRYQADVERQSLVHAGVRRAQTRYGYYNGYYFTPNFSTYYMNPRAINAEENEKSAIVRFSNWRDIEDKMVEIRRSLTQKYNIEFIE